LKLIGWRAFQVPVDEFNAFGFLPEGGALVFLRFGGKPYSAVPGKEGLIKDTQGNWLY